MVLLALLSAPEAGDPAVRVGGERVEDPGRWLEHAQRDEVIAWWQERQEADSAWLEEGGTLSAIEAWLVEERESRKDRVWLRDHRAGVSLWQRTERVVKPPEGQEGEVAALGDPGAEEGGEAPARPDRRWVNHLSVQRPGEAWPGTELPLAEEDRFKMVCAAYLGPGGEQLLYGRQAVGKDLPEEERGEPQACPLELLDLASGEHEALGSWTWPQPTW